MKLNKIKMTDIYLETKQENENSDYCKRIFCLVNDIDLMQF